MGVRGQRAAESSRPPFKHRGPRRNRRDPNGTRCQGRLGTPFLGLRTHWGVQRSACLQVKCYNVHVLIN